VQQAIAEVEGWLAHPNVRIVSEDADHWRLLRPYVEQTGTAGNLTTDAHLASLAIAHGAVLASCDTDFALFSKLRWENPLTSSVP
jgi:predicted nucleic acid-binding protein